MKIRIKTLESARNTPIVERRITGYWCRKETLSGWTEDENLGKVYNSLRLMNYGDNYFHIVTDEACYPQLCMIEEEYES